MGAIMADDQLRFMIDVEDDQIRLRFIDSDEIFYLTSEPAPLGGRVLKYDTGEVALQVAGWGGLTLYTENDRGGVPAERADDESDGFEPAPVAAKDVKGFALKLAQDLAVAHDFGIGFAADWDELAQGDGVRRARRRCDAQRRLCARQAGRRRPNARPSPTGSTWCA